MTKKVYLPQARSIFRKYGRACIQLVHTCCPEKVLMPGFTLKGCALAVALAKCERGPCDRTFVLLDRIHVKHMHSSAQ